MANEELGLVLTRQMEQPSVLDALPADLNKQRFVHNAIAAVNGSDQLQRMPQAKLVPPIMKGAMLGLDFFNKEAFLVPYGQDVQFMPSYTGMVKLAKKYGHLKSCYAKVVRDGDEFQEEVVDGRDTVSFKPVPFNDGAIVGAFAVATFEDGTSRVEVMSKRQLDDVKRMSKSQTGTAWKFFPDQMYLKSVVRRLCKNITLDFENPEQAAMFQGDPDMQRSEPQRAYNPFAEDVEVEDA